MNSRVFHFGKYKGEDVNFIILTHIGYILWLMENTRFKLNEFEQELFDARAKAILNSKITYVYDKQGLAKYIKDKNSWTPFVVKADGNWGFLKEYGNDPIVGIFKKYRNKMDKPILRELNYDHLFEIAARMPVDNYTEDDDAVDYIYSDFFY